MESPPFIHNAAGFLNTAKPESAPSDVQRVVQILSESRRPVLVAGNGVHVAGAHAQLQELAELWGMPVATSYKGKSAIAETHPLSVGMVGTYGQEVANRVVGEADTVVVVGALLRSQETVRERPDIFDPRRQRVVQIDIDERNAGWSFPVEIGLVGDAGSILNQLVDGIEGSSGGQCGAAQGVDGFDGATQGGDGLLRRPRDAQGQLAGDAATAGLDSQRNVSDPSTVYALDAGNNRTWMAHLYKAQEAATFYCPGGTAGMGWALPAAVALKLVYPDRPVTAVTGDGGYMMTVNALSTAMQYDLPMTCVVFNDNALGMVLDHQPRGQEIASEFYPTDNAAIARGFGCFGVHVEDSRDLPDALREARDSGLPAVVDVAIDREPSPDDWRADARRAGET